MTLAQEVLDLVSKQDKPVLQALQKVISHLTKEVKREKDFDTREGLTQDLETYKSIADKVKLGNKSQAQHLFDKLDGIGSNYLINAIFKDKGLLKIVSDYLNFDVNPRL